MVQNFDYAGMAQLVVSLGAFIGAIVAAVISLRSIKEVKEVKVSVKEVGGAVDVKMDELIESRAKQATAEAILGEKEAESARRLEGDQDDPEDRRHAKAKKPKPKI